MEILFENNEAINEPSQDILTSDIINDVNINDDVPEGIHVIKRDPAVLGIEGPESQSETTQDLFTPDSSLIETPPAEGYADAGMLSSKQVRALQILAPAQLALFVQFVDTLRRQRRDLSRRLECAFCKNNGEAEAWYATHALKDWRGRVLCPVLRAFRCPRCGATGDRAHTIKYCPENNADCCTATL